MTVTSINNDNALDVSINTTNSSGYIEPKYVLDVLWYRKRTQLGEIPVKPHQNRFPFEHSRTKCFTEHSRVKNQHPHK